MSKILRRNQVEERTGLARSTIYLLMNQSKFPSSFKLNDSRAVGWSEDDIEEWILSKINSTDGEAKHD